MQLTNKGRLAYYSVGRGRERGEVTCSNVTTYDSLSRRRRRLRLKRVTSWQESAKCRQWFVSMRRNGQLKLAQQSESRDRQSADHWTFHKVKRHDIYSSSDVTFRPRIHDLDLNLFHTTPLPPSPPERDIDIISPTDLSSNQPPTDARIKNKKNKKMGRDRGRSRSRDKAKKRHSCTQTLLSNCRKYKGRGNEVKAKKTSRPHDRLLPLIV